MDAAAAMSLVRLPGRAVGGAATGGSEEMGGGVGNATGAGGASPAGGERGAGVATVTGVGLGGGTGAAMRVCGIGWRIVWAGWTRGWATGAGVAGAGGCAGVAMGFPHFRQNFATSGLELPQ